MGVDFDVDYWHSLDKQSAKNLEVSVKDLGISAKMGDVVKNLNAHIFEGASHVEIGFMGKGKGYMGQGNTTPEMFGKDKREAIRELNKINKVTTSVHASVAVGNLSGLGERGFSEELRKDNLDEMRRTIDFAAETTEGGPIVVHTGEFPRSIVTRHKEFERYADEEKKAVQYMVDRNSGQIIEVVRNDAEMWMPEYEVDEKGNPRKLMDFDGKERIVEVPGGLDENGNLKPPKRIYIHEVKRDQYGNLKMNPYRFNKEFKEEYIKEHGKWDYEDAAKKYFEKTKEIEIESAYGQADEYEWRYERALKERKEYTHLLKEWEDAKKQFPVELNEQAKKILFANKFGEKLTRQLEMEGASPDEFLRENLKFAEKQINSSLETARSARQRAAQIQKQINDAESIDRYGLEKSTQSIAEAALYAREKTKQQKLKDPLFVAPENLFPEMGYGGHPEELKEIIKRSREEMAKKLVNYNGLSPREAEKEAEKHIKATFDIGHAYTWKKFFKAKEGESEEERNKRFDKWLMNEVDDLVKEGIIGHVHISDNFGYQDEHLTPGEGSAPLKEFVNKIKKSGKIKGPMVIEWGAQDEGKGYEAMLGGWRHLVATPIYASKKWVDVEGSYFGNTERSNYIIGKATHHPSYIGVEENKFGWTGLSLD